MSVLNGMGGLDTMINDSFNGREKKGNGKKRINMSDRVRVRKI